MVERVRFGILAPRPPRSANKGDVESNGLPVRQTPREYKECILRFEYLIDPKPHRYINTNKKILFLGKFMRNIKGLALTVQK